MTLRDQINGALTALQQIAGEPVIYARGETTLQLVLIPGRSDRPALQQIGLSFEPELCQWSGRVDELVLDDTPTMPQQGDTITRTLNGKTEVWEVMPPGSQSQPYAIDPTGAKFRAFTQLQSRT